MGNSISIYLFAPFVAWLSAQCLKSAIAVIRNKGNKKHYAMFYKSGGMPSGHAATMVALMAVVGTKEGLTSALFGVVAIVSAVVLYDAINVRRAVGEQGEFLKELAYTAKKPAVFYTAHGHRITEVIAGAVLGLCVAAIMLQII